MQTWLDRTETLLERLPIRHILSNKMVPFHWNFNQAKRYAMIKEQWNREGKIRVLDLKSRRVGVSAQTDAIFWSAGMAFTNYNIKIVAHRVPSAEELFRVPSDLSRAFPGFDPKDIQMKRIFFPHEGGKSQITLATAGTPDAGRGGTLSALHLSEAAYYPDDESFTAMITSVSKGPGSMVVIESTANGREGPGEAFYEYWTNAVAGRNGYIPVFLCWMQDPACVRPEEEADDAPADDLEKELMNPPFNATREQIAWMRKTKSEDCRDVEAKWLQDYPHCPEVAFQVSGSPAFAREEIAYGYTTVKPPLCRGEFIRSANGGFRFERKANGRVYIWKFPFDKNGKSDGFKYYIGADSAAGVEDRDFAAAAVLCGQTGELAARFSETIDPEAFADQLDMMARWYNMAMVNPELTGGLGRWTLVKLRDVFRYPNICKWKGRFDRKRGKDISNALGFEMNNSTRRLIIDASRSGMRMAMKHEPGGLSINDDALMQQISLCTIKEWRWEVARGHDDILVAWAIAVLTREEFPPARMTFGAKNIMEPETPQGKMEGLGLGQVKLESELPGQFQAEMRMIMRRAGLKANMRGNGVKHRDRLVGI